MLGAEKKNHPCHSTLQCAWNISSVKISMNCLQTNHIMGKINFLPSFANQTPSTFLRFCLLWSHRSPTVCCWFVSHGSRSTFSFRPSLFRNVLILVQSLLSFRIRSLISSPSVLLCTFGHTIMPHTYTHTTYTENEHNFYFNHRTIDRMSRALSRKMAMFGMLTSKMEPLFSMVCSYHRTGVCLMVVEIPRIHYQP